MALPAISSRYSRATAICPGWPRARWMRSSKGASLPFSASTDMAPATHGGAEHVFGAEQTRPAPARWKPACR